jgi:hypothetical protein
MVILVSADLTGVLWVGRMFPCCTNSAPMPDDFLQFGVEEEAGELSRSVEDRTEEANCIVPESLSSVSRAEEGGWGC